MKHLYGEFSQHQIESFKKSIQSSIFFLLLYVDPKTANQYDNVDVNKSFQGLLLKLGGYNELLECPVELVHILSLLEAARKEFNSFDFDFQIYRKLILDAGAEVARLKEVD